MTATAPGFEHLRAALIERWKAAWDRIGECELAMHAAAKTVYTEYPAFALEGYARGRLKAGARLLAAANTDGRSYRFELDAAGRPLRVRNSHPVNHVSWDGLYTYAPTQVEHIEWCVETGVPWLYDRVLLDEHGSVLAEQRYRVNAGGHRPVWVNAPRDQVMATILADDHNFLYLRRYVVEDGVTRSGEEYHHTNLGIDRAALEYTYAPDGKLLRIVQHWPTGSRTTFAAKSKTTPKELAEAVARKLTDAVLRTLREASFDAPLTLLELGYRDGARYVPSLVPVTTADAVSGLALAAEIDASRWLTLDDDVAAPELAELEQRAGDNSLVLVKTLRTVARAVTERARAELPVTTDFVAFAIDWETEGDKLRKILKDAGASDERLRDWKKRRWL